MVKTRTKLGLTARSEQRKGFAMPTLKKIRSALMTISKRRLADLVLFLFSQVSKTVKIRVLMRIERAPKKSKGRTRRKSTKRKARRRKATTRRKKRKASRRKASGRKKPRTAKQRAATRKLVARNKARRRRR